MRATREPTSFALYASIRLERTSSFRPRASPGAYETSSAIEVLRAPSGTYEAPHELLLD